MDWFIVDWFNKGSAWLHECGFAYAWQLKTACWLCALTGVLSSLGDLSQMISSIAVALVQVWVLSVNEMARKRQGARLFNLRQDIMNHSPLAAIRLGIMLFGVFLVFKQPLAYWDIPFAVIWFYALATYAPETPPKIDLKDELVKLVWRPEVVPAH